MFIIGLLKRLAGKARCTAWVAALLLLAPIARAADLDQEIQFDITPQPLVSALIEFSKQAGMQVMSSGVDLGERKSPGLSGRYRISEALHTLLAGTGLAYKATGPNTIVITVQASAGNVVDPVDPQAIETIPVQPADTARKKEEPPPPPEPQIPAELETVTVTASKRAQALEKVPGSVAALSGNQLEKMHAKDMEDYLKLVPGVSFSKGEADMGVPIIRGVGTNTSLGGQTGQPVGIFIDDVAFTDAALPLQIPDLNPFDLERVEILKGPQGTLFGASSLAGAIHYITHKPDLGVWESKFQGSETAVEDPSDRKPMGALALNIPLGSSAALRGVGLYRMAPGYIDETQRGEKDVNSLRQHAGRLLGAWDINDRLSLSGAYFRQFDKQDDTNIADQPKRLERNSTPEALPIRQTFGIANLVAKYDFDWATLLSSTSRKTKNTVAVARSDSALGPGGSGTPNPTGGASGANSPGAEDQNAASAIPVFDGITVRGYSQEFRLTSPEGLGAWEWLGGGYFLIDRQKLDEEVPNAQVFGAPTVPPLPGPTATPIGPAGDSRFATEFGDAFVNQRTIEASLFGEATRRIGERWALTAGGRLFRTAFNADVLINGAPTVALTEDPTMPSTTPTRKPKEVEYGFNPKISARFQVNPNVMTYALVSKGFQFGGAQFALVLPTAETGVPPTFKSSTLWNFELGTRTEWLNRRLSLDATVFYERWSDLQLTEVTEGLAAGQVKFNFIDNVGRAHTLGGEVGLRAIPFTGLTLGSSLARINAVTDVPFESPDGPVPSGTRLPGTPRFQIANVLSYERPFGGWTPGLSLTHSRIGTSFNNLQQDHKLGGYNTLDARIDLLKSNLAFQPDLSFSVTNIFDKRGISGAGGSPSQDRVQFFRFIRPRTAELTLGFRFN